MHTKIENLINRAKENGSMTERQRGLILSKAKELGDDLDEIEFSLEDIPIKDFEQQDITSQESSPADDIKIDDLISKPAVSSGDPLKSMTVSLKTLNNKGCRKGCLLLIIGMVALCIIGLLYDFIIGAL